MSSQSYKRKLAAILCADVEGYSRMMGQDEAATLETLTARLNLIGKLIDKHGGQVFSSPGDAVLAQFASVVAAVEAAEEIQHELEVKNAGLAEESKMRFRIGINLGDVLLEGELIYGDGVNIAARIEGLAEPGGISLSGAAYDQVEGKLDLGFQFQGEMSLKNIKKPVRIYKFKMEGQAGLAGATAQPPLPDKPSLAVLPFLSIGGDAEQEYFCDGISEEIITALSKLPDLFVIARNSTFVYKGKPVNVQQVGRELGVRYVLEGSVRRGGDRLRITAQLIDAQSGHHLWAERYDRGMADVFALQDEITMQIVHALDLKLITGEQSLAYRLKTPDLDAALKMFQARGLITRSKEGMVKARQICEEVVAAEPQWATPYGALGYTHWVEVLYGWSDSPLHSLQKALEYANKCIELDDLNPIGHGLLALLFLMMRQYEQAMAEGRKAVDVAPSSADAHAWFAMVQVYAGEPARAINLLEKAIRLNPFPPGLYLGIMGAAYSKQGEYDQAASFLRQALAKEPNLIAAHAGIAKVYVRMGQIDKARAHAQEILRIDPGFTLERFRQTALHKDVDYTEQFVDALRKAGLK